MLVVWDTYFVGVVYLILSHCIHSSKGEERYAWIFFSDSILR